MEAFISIICLRNWWFFDWSGNLSMQIAWVLFLLQNSHFLKLATLNTAESTASKSHLSSNVLLRFNSIHTINVSDFYGNINATAARLCKELMIWKEIDKLSHIHNICRVFIFFFLQISPIYLLNITISCTHAHKL